jgi:hypothetical protein
MNFKTDNKYLFTCRMTAITEKPNWSEQMMTIHFAGKTKMSSARVKNDVAGLWLWRTTAKGAGGTVKMWFCSWLC